jgi:hypothetical protein
MLDLQPFIEAFNKFQEKEGFSELDNILPLLKVWQG